MEEKALTAYYTWTIYLKYHLTLVLRKLLEKEKYEENSALIEVNVFKRSCRFYKL